MEEVLARNQEILQQALIVILERDPTYTRTIRALLKLKIHCRTNVDLCDIEKGPIKVDVSN